MEHERRHLLPLPIAEINNGKASSKDSRKIGEYFCGGRGSHYNDVIYYEVYFENIGNKYQYVYLGCVGQMKAGLA